MKKLKIKIYRSGHSGISYICLPGYDYSCPILPSQERIALNLTNIVLMEKGLHIDYLIRSLKKHVGSK